MDGWLYGLMGTMLFIISKTPLRLPYWGRRRRRRRCCEVKLVKLGGYVPDNLSFKCAGSRGNHLPTYLWETRDLSPSVVVVVPPGGQASLLGLISIDMHCYGNHLFPRGIRKKSIQSSNNLMEFQRSTK